LKLAGREQGDEVVELVQAILNRRGGEQQQVLLLEIVDELPRDAGAALEMMRLIHNDQVIGRRRDAGAVLGPAGSGQRGDYPWETFPGRRPMLAELGAARGDEPQQAELGLQLFA